MFLREVTDMTRGTLAIISDNNKMFISIEFNGDMYLSGYGIDAIKCLENVDTEDDFEDAVRDFDAGHHRYNEKQMILEIKDIKPYLDMTKNYFDNWFSDYVFLKNVSTEIVTVTDAGNDTIKICPDEIAVFNFGKYIDTTNVTTELYETTVNDYGEELGYNEEDILTIVANGREICGVYEDTYDVGKEWACNVYGIDDWLDNDRYINFEKIGEDVVENGDTWLQLPSGKYAHLS
jgi:hypothetical protein